MTIERLDIMFCHGHRFYELSKAVCALEWLPVPCQGGRLAIEVGKICETCIGVVGGIIYAREVICSPCGNFDAGRGL